MQQLLQVWSALNMRKQIMVGVATVAMFAAILGMSRLVAAPNMVLLYAGLESAAAGEVVQALEQRGVAYQVRGGSIFVEDRNRDELRMTLASAGLPANGGSGYELLDNLTGFGTTSQMFNAAYWRAKEGELARTMLASPNITKARVHIANASSSPFQRELKPSASVSVVAAGGLTPAHARALRYLVASAVAGLEPKDVVIIDSVGNLVSTDETTVPAVADDRSTELRERVQRLLEARVGPGNAVVEVSVDTVTESESIRQRTFDPASRVLVSSDSEESTNDSRNNGGGEVTVASNIPSGDANGAENASSQTSQTRERVNYEVSETQREIIRAPGSVKRQTVAVLVNGVESPGPDGATTIQLRDDAELQALRELVASAVGYDESRGDVITIKSMIFQPVIPLGTEASTSLLDLPPLDVMTLLKLAVAALVTLILGLFVVRPILSRPPLPEPDQPARLQAALTGEIDDGDTDLSGLPVVGNATLSPPAAHSQEDAVERLRSLINDRRDETVEILRSWLEDEEDA
ncbi:flagellar basal-body MS-ring/collar protein FliF [Thalassovita sp.]|uniref:flagellar basal-body MS-ring/collar protein FliF n=1 Tax=Thalassovita sp. TaxID=1979401 RepID=UPI0029DE5A3A|nr:flagellar basal-body MS-ring/collar protein FliF [Thalassovita sp.]